MDLHIKGKVFRDEKTLEKYSEDRSPYRIKPKIVAIPRTESDIIEIMKYSRKNSIPITARCAGSSLSGAALGDGLVIDFSGMDKIIRMNKNRIRVQPGVIYDGVNKAMEKLGYFLPYSPSSGSFCTIGGNVGTKASGFRGVKYGSADNYVKSIRFVDSQARIIDTSQSLPADIEESILDLKKKLINDKKAMGILKSRERLKTSSGYNLWALYKYKMPEDIVTHLLVGSAGTLGLFTEIELELAPAPKNTITCITYFKSLKEAGLAVLKILELNPSALEIMDSFSLNLIREHADIPEQSRAVLLVEFDYNLVQSEKRLKEILNEHAIEYAVETKPERQEKLWNIRKSMLSIIEERHEKSVSFVDDVGVPVEHLTDLIQDLQKIFQRNDTKAVMYGHAGEGNLHVRPLTSWIDKTKIKKLADECMRAVFKYQGTVTAEHGSGRNRAPYLKSEWGDNIYSYFIHVKKLFDPDNLLNPDIMFSGNDITEYMKY